MHAYRTHIVIADPDHTVLTGLPFQIGQRVEVVLLEESEQVTKIMSLGIFSSRNGCTPQPVIRPSSFWPTRMRMFIAGLSGCHRQPLQVVC